MSSFWKIGCLLALMVQISMTEARAVTLPETPRDLTEKVKEDKATEEENIEREAVATLEEEFTKGSNPDKIGSAAPKTDVSEEKVPVLTKASAPKGDSSNPFFRVILALGVVCVAGLGALVYIKKFRKLTTSKGPAPKIQVLTQHFLGPKKSLAIVKIAGESILIGITDHNITPIRVLALLDDELPVQNPKDFNAAMQGFDFVDDTKDEFEFHSPGNYR